MSPVLPPLTAETELTAWRLDPAMALVAAALLVGRLLLVRRVVRHGGRP